MYLFSNGNLNVSCGSGIEVYLNVLARFSYMYNEKYF